jgi:hypothetical protein
MLTAVVSVLQLLKQSSKTRLVTMAGIVGFAALGVYLLQQSGAAGFMAASEAEAGTVVGNASQVSDTAASNGQAVRFGGGSSTQGPTAFGTLVSQPNRSQAESDAGVKVAMVEFWWGELEPQEGQFNTSYLNEIKDEIDTHLAAGRRVTLALGMHDAPSWMANVPNSRYVNEDGQQSGADDYNMVFNQLVRDKAERYFTKLDQELDLSRFWAIRLTTGSYMEMHYPGGGWWAYDVNAKNGPNMPASMQRNPFPDFKPGDTSYTTAQARQWAEWYIGALGNVTDFQMKSLTAKGFRGYFETVTPGAGVKPSRYERAINNRLVNDDLLGMGIAWHRYYASIPDKNRVIAYSSSVAENSAGPGDGDSCQASDETVPMDSEQFDNWSAARWISRIADEYGMRKGGENPGMGMPANPDYSDTSPSGMMASAFRYASTCKFHVFYWAHDHNLHNGDVPFSKYAEGIRDALGDSPSAPPMP